ncbi:hypothetical protein HDU97_009709 [Phlyctochytrium planicorne]|nr:hypothetical protein HDU97_009709 [Phlyctochytrium planicorne]
MPPRFHQPQRSSASESFDASQRSGDAPSPFGPKPQDVVYVQLRGKRFRIPSEILGLLPDSLLMTLFPSGLIAFYPPSDGVNKHKAPTVRHRPECEVRMNMTLDPLESKDRPGSRMQRHPIESDLESMESADLDCISDDGNESKPSDAKLAEPNEFDLSLERPDSGCDCKREEDDDSSIDFSDQDPFCGPLLDDIESFKFVQADLDPSMFHYMLRSLSALLNDNKFLALMEKQAAEARKERSPKSESKVQVDATKAPEKNAPQQSPSQQTPGLWKSLLQLGDLLGVAGSTSSPKKTALESIPEQQPAEQKNEPKRSSSSISLSQSSLTTVLSPNQSGEYLQSRSNSLASRKRLESILSLREEIEFFVVEISNGHGRLNDVPGVPLPKFPANTSSPPLPPGQPIPTFQEIAVPDNDVIIPIPETTTPAKDEFLVVKDAPLLQHPEEPVARASGSRALTRFKGIAGFFQKAGSSIRNHFQKFRGRQQRTLFGSKMAKPSSASLPMVEVKPLDSNDTAVTSTVNESNPQEEGVAIAPTTSEPFTEVVAMHLEKTNHEIEAEVIRRLKLDIQCRRLILSKTLVKESYGERFRAGSLSNDVETVGVGIEETAIQSLEDDILIESRPNTIVPAEAAEEESPLNQVPSVEMATAKLNSLTAAASVSTLASSSSSSSSDSSHGSSNGSSAIRMAVQDAMSTNVAPCNPTSSESSPITSVSDTFSNPITSVSASSSTDFPNMSRSFSKVTFSSDDTASTTSSTSSADSITGLHSVAENYRRLAKNQIAPPVALQLEHFVSALEVFAEYDSSTEWGHRIVDETGKILSVIVLPARDRMAYEARMRANNQVIVGSDGHAKVSDQSKLPLLMVPGLVQHLTSKLPVRKCWWEVLDLYIDCMGNLVEAGPRVDAALPRLPLRRSLSSRAGRSIRSSLESLSNGIEKRAPSVAQSIRTAFGLRQEAPVVDCDDSMATRRAVRLWIRRTWLAEFVAMS